MKPSPNRKKKQGMKSKFYPRHRLAQTPWSRALLEKLVVSYLTKNVSVFFGT
jgi:hypothetical protein